ncbi:MAG: TonB-dependent receptor [Lentisphaeraceae bacterium]|nr:TonB-dependent receptor [Lentisphaeraceae bacterium]
MLIFLFLITYFVHGQSEAEDFLSTDLDLSMTLEDLMNVEIVTASKKKESFFETSSAVYVVTAEDMKRRGVKNVVEALRGVPGVQVSQRSNNSWEVAIRGFDNLFSNKLLVLVDGRSVYSPVFSGVYWSTVNYPIEDLKRIEVVRGPGSTVWGANAVNGVINIITKSSKETTGTFLQAEYGTESEEYTIRHGFAVDEEEKMHMRVYGQFQNLEPLDYGTRPAPSNNEDGDWDNIMGGMRLDYEITEFESLRLSADGFSQKYTALNSLTTRSFHENQTDGFNTILEYNKEISATESFSTKFYYDYLHLNEEGRLSHKTHTYDGSATYSVILGEIHDLTLGGGARIINNISEDSSNLVNIQPRRDSVVNYNLFLQDKITLIDSKLYLTLGSKVDFLEYTGTEVQPSAKLTYLVNENNTVWLSATESARSPSRYEHNGVILYAVNGNDDVETEKLKAYEVGYRRKFENAALTMTAFYFDYDDLVQVDSGTFNLVNSGSADSYGFELAFDYNLRENWKVRTSYTYFDADFDTPAQSQEILFYEDKYANNKVAIHSYLEITKSMNWDLSAYYTDSRDTYGSVNQHIGSYIKLDSRLSWQVNDKFECYLLFKNLLDSSTRETGQTYEVPRSGSIGVVYRF